ncbi:helix-turn-helix domain-containing protein [Ascidiimonas sp. W6]|uniref:helix-turn-helix domain-containing protein n=1 Tax=Ascidiimonas meishanensis TaxID=3128903 RepID=UPI0030EE22B8
MKEIEIKDSGNSNLLKELNGYFNGSLTDQLGEQVLNFKNNYGKGVVRSISFDWGVQLIDYDVCFKEDVRLTSVTGNQTPVEFIFISEGSIKFSNDAERMLDLNRYQNIIISNKRKTKNILVFPGGKEVKINFIQINKAAYVKKKHYNLNYLNEVLHSVFESTSNRSTFKHFGNYNLKIADEVKLLNDAPKEGIVRALSIEGRINLILAMQLMEHHNFENRETLPESISKGDIKKIHKLSEYIFDNISEHITIAILATEAGISPKKLQAGFKVLYGKSVNEYIRQLKLEIARDYLQKGEMSISEIVYNIGFKSRSYFSKIFFDQYGMLPTVYKKMVK